MKFVKAQCVNCNGELEVDPGLSTAYCIYCGTKFLIDKAINHYRINHVDKIDAEVVNVYNSGGNSRGYTGNVEEDIQKVEQLLKMGEIEKADEIIEDLKANYPSDCRVWFVCLKNYFFKGDLHSDLWIRCIKNISKIDKSGGITNEARSEMYSYLKEKVDDIRQKLDEDEKVLQSLANEMNIIRSRVKSSQGDELRKKKSYYRHREDWFDFYKGIIIVVTAILSGVFASISSGDGWQIIYFLSGLIGGGIFFGVIVVIVFACLKSNNKRQLKELECRLKEVEEFEQSAECEIDAIRNRYNFSGRDYSILKEDYESFCRELKGLGWF